MKATPMSVLKNLRISNKVLLIVGLFVCLYLVLLGVGTYQLSKLASAAQNLPGSGSAEELRRWADDAIWLMSWLSTAGLLTVSALALWVVQRDIAGPLKAITDTMARFSRGDVNPVLDITERGDEIGELARSLRTLQQAALDKSAREKEAEKQRQADEGTWKSRFEAQIAIATEHAVVIGHLIEGLMQIAGGKFSHRLPENFPDSHRKLRDDVHSGLEQVTSTLTSLKATAAGIRASTEEISQSSEDFSRHTERQAASLEETAAALDQITTAVRRSADGAAEAHNVVVTATADAERGGKVMQDAVGAMSQIEQSARKISHITTVIDEIAFQTNLLALNAGVEAARAGEAGKGFAVVASEVRALAQRSAAAAKEIDGLLSASTEQVSTGVERVAQAGEALSRIVVNIAEINKLVGDIAASAKEQATGLQEINCAIEQLDQVTQQNASMIEESTAASFGLAQESHQLVNLLNRFTSDRVMEPAVPARARLKEAPSAPKPVRSIRTVAAVATARTLAAAKDEWEEF